ncbi:MAG: Asp-tRNA(Asn)/Glu-tRNA(Gln) amidotransferase subunit GatA [Candidatus Gracilibacteria bacterium]|nr:Asp-tRNA(Asn)/Glu-tRNA(Gln) amidotransferase subunit GatA [Candidatus Gracilibacteria bacterium]
MSLNELTIHEARAKLAKKEVSALELTQSCFERIEKVDSKLNAFISLNKKEALKEAGKIDEQIAKGKALGVFAGIPMALKDVFCTKGIETTACSNILKGFVPPYDATTVSKLKEQGTILLGKLNTDEFTCGASTETSCFGPTKCPWDTDRVAGGSSGGSAAAVSADEAFFTLGTDTGGSIRQPAALCGCSGLKVTYGRVSRFGVISMASSWDTIGPLAKDVEDLALIMNVIAGPDQRDATTPQVKVSDYTKSLKADVKGLKIGVPKEYFGEGVEKETAKIVRDAIKEFEKAGAIVKEVSLPYTKYGVAVYYVVMPSEVSSNMARYDNIRYGSSKVEAEDLIDHYFKARAKGFGPEMKRRIMIGAYALSAGYYDAYYLKAQKVRTLIINDFNQAFSEVDVLMAPTSPFPAFKLGEKANDPLAMYLADALTIPASAAGIPALSVPCGFSKDKLPIGLQIIAPQFREDLLMQVGFAYQNLSDWHKQKPDLDGHD